MIPRFVLALAVVASLAACGQTQPSSSPVNGAGGKIVGGPIPANIPANEKQPLTTNPKGPLGP